MSTQIFLSDKAFMNVILSSIEVYQKECLGVLLGYRTQGMIVVEYAIPLQTAQRKYSEVSSNRRREHNVLSVLKELIQFDKLGYYHSHPQYGDTKGVARLSEEDKESMTDGEIELIVAINDSKRGSWWKEKGKRLTGTIGPYRFDMAGYYHRKSDHKYMQYRLVCPYAVGFDQAFAENG